MFCRLYENELYHNQYSSKPCAITPHRLHRPLEARAFMKNQKDIIAILIAVFITQFVNMEVQCQAYSKLLEYDKTWNIMHWTCGYGPCSNHTYVYSIEKDSIINDMVYHEIDGRLLREDTVEMKVYQWHDYFEEDKLLYDFTLSKGDSVDILERYDQLLVVDSVYEILFNDEPRKYIDFKEVDGFDEFWIEGIGSNYGVLYPGFYLSLIDAGFELLCVFQGDSLIFQNSGSCFISNVSVEKEIYNETKVVFTENPFRLNLKGFNGPNIILQIFDIKGVMTDQIKFNSDSQSSIVLSGYEPGLYVYRILDNNNPTQGKFIIHK